MNFEESVKYLYSLGNEVEAMKLGLENTRKLLAALGNPQDNFLKVQVAGTNGKGSVCAFLNAICVSAGIKTGLYTSPHLISITERIKVNGIDISEEDFAHHATHVRETAEKLHTAGGLAYRPTFFEQITAIALIAFAGAKVDLAILETGLGGRLDATTAANAEIAAITQIDYDHQNYLGETIEEIAGEKAAIIHEGSKIVIGEQKPETMDVLASVCANFGVSPKLANEVVAETAGGNTSGNECVKLAGEKNTHFLPVVFPPRTPISFQTPRRLYRNIQLGLSGRHQIENAKIAILLAETLQYPHFNITTENIIEGLQTAVHPGRLEFTNGILFDGAHNPAGAKALKKFLYENAKHPIVMIFGLMKDKDVSKIAEILFPLAETLILTQPDNSRAMAAAEIAEYTRDHKNVILTKTVEDAIKKAQAISNNEKLILVTGSLYLIGEAKKILNHVRQTF